MRGVLLGVVLTIGAQLLLVLLLRTLWARQALASLDSWLQRTFGVSLQRSNKSIGGNGSDSDRFVRDDAEGDFWGHNGRAVGGNGKPLSRAGSDASSTYSSNGSSSSTSASGEGHSSVRLLCVCLLDGWLQRYVGSCRGALHAGCSNDMGHMQQVLQRTAVVTCCSWGVNCCLLLWHVEQTGLSTYVPACLCCCCHLPACARTQNELLWYTTRLGRVWSGSTCASARSGASTSAAWSAGSRTCCSRCLTA